VQSSLKTTKLNKLILRFQFRRFHTTAYSCRHVHGVFFSAHWIFLFNWRWLQIYDGTKTSRSIYSGQGAQSIGNYLLAYSSVLPSIWRAPLVHKSLICRNYILRVDSDALFLLCSFYNLLVLYLDIIRVLDQKPLYFRRLHFDLIPHCIILKRLLSIQPD